MLTFSIVKLIMAMLRLALKMAADSLTASTIEVIATDFP
jgi:hypothetical protein